MFVRPEDASTIIFTGRFMSIAEAYSTILAVSGVYMLGSIYSKIKSKELRSKLVWVSVGLAILLGGVIVEVVLRKMSVHVAVPFHCAILLMSLFVAYPFIRGGSNAK